MRAVTAGMLAQLLAHLPPETLVWEASWCGDRPMDRTDMLGPDEYCPLMVWNQNGETRLYFHDGEAAYPEYRGIWQPLFWRGAAWDRIAVGEGDTRGEKTNPS